MCRVLGNRLIFTLTFIVVFAVYCFAAAQVQAEDLDLRRLIDEALRNSPDLHASGYRTSAAEYRIPQAKTLPDPMITFGYQNEGFTKFTYGNPNNANTQGIVSVAQSFPFPGKLALRGEAAAKESESMGADYEALRLKIIARVKEVYFDLYNTYKSIDLINERTDLFTQVENAALARYSTGKGSQQEVLMAQTEKYMLLEKGGNAAAKSRGARCHDECSCREASQCAARKALLPAARGPGLFSR